jgi:hypothetical protein
MNAHNDKEFLNRVRQIVKEIEKHKWFESEKAGRDIGGNRAALDWLKNHYEEWKKNKGES